jgi:hypothetical protein
LLQKNSVLLCVFLWAKGLSAKHIHKKMFTVANVTSICFVHQKKKHLGGKYFGDDEEIETGVRK